MTKIIFVDDQGAEVTVEAHDGDSVMEAAIKNNVSGILAECGGACACATCHVYVDQEFWDIVGAPNEMEEAMLDFNEHRQPNSRLSCQIEVSHKLDGLTLAMPPEQA